MTDFADLGVRVNTDQAVKARRDLDAMAKAGDKASDSNKGVGDSSKTASEHMKSLGGAAKLASGALAGFAVAGQFRAVVNESEQLQRNMLRTEQLIVSTGRTASTSAEQLRTQARQLARSTLESTEGIMQAQQMLLTFRNVGVESFDEVTERALDLASVTGGNLSSTMNQLARALENPVQGLAAMSRSGVSFSETQKNMITRMVEMNDTAGAQRVILDEMARQYGGVAKREAEKFAGAQDTLAQAVQEARLALADKTGVVDILTDNTKQLAAAVDALTEAYLSGDYDTQLEIFKNISLAAGAAGLAYGGYRTAVVLATAAQLAFNAALRANPLILAATGVAALAATTYTLVTANKAAQESEVSLRAAAMQSAEAQRAVRVAAIDAEIESLRTGTELNQMLASRTQLFELHEQAVARGDTKSAAGLRHNLNLLDNTLASYDNNIAKIEELTRAKDKLNKVDAEIATDAPAVVDLNAQAADMARLDSRAATLVEIERLERSFLTTQDALTQEYLEQQGVIASALGEGVIATEEANALKLASDQEYAAQKAAIERESAAATLAAYGTTLTAMQSFADNALSALEAYGAESSTLGQVMLTASKLLMVAQAVMAAEMSAVMTRAAYAGAAVFAGPAAPAVLAAGETHANINRGLGYASAALIAATQFAPARELGGQVQAGQSVIVGESGPERLTLGTNAHITSNKNMQEGGGQTIVMQVSTGVAETVRAEISSLMPQIMRIMSQQRAQ